MGTASGTRYYVYDAVGDLVRYTDRDGRVTTYAYDALGRETAEYWLDSNGDIIAADTTTSAYDALGRLVSATDAAVTYTYTYDDLGRLLTQTDVFADLSATVVFTYTYNALGECTLVEQTVGGTAHLVMTATYSYDDCGNLTGLVYTNASNATLRSFAWTYDALGQVSSQNSDLDAEDVTAYTYDATGQLVSVDYTDALKTDESYAYDETGNRTAANADTYTTGDANQTTSDGTYSYTYDENGNLAAKYVDADSDDSLDAGDTDITEYTWDVRNRLVEASHRSLFNGDLDWTAQYDYDVFNHRIASRYDDDGDGIADRVERYVWDGDQIVLEFVDSDGGNNSLNEGTSSAPLALATRYVWGQAVDQLLAQETVSNGSPADVSYIVRDNQGSTRSLVNHLGDVTATYSYDSYGNVSVITGSLADTRFLYTCQEYDSRLGLYYYNARWYSPTLGRFISEDPMGFAAGDANLYRYVGNSPTTYTDPSGLCEESNGGAASDLVFRPGDMPVRAELENLVFSDYVGVKSAALFAVDSVSGTVRQAAAQGNLSLLEDLLASGGLDEVSAAAARAAIARLKSTAAQIIARECKGSIWRVFPSQFRNMTLAAIKKLASEGNKAAQTALKLLTDGRFKKK